MAKVNITEEEHVVLFTGYNKQDLSQLGVDAHHCAVLDSAGSSTVCAKMWLDEYVKGLDWETVTKREGEKVFKFGGGTKLKSEGEYSIPAVTAGKAVKIQTDLVDSDIPPLLSRTAMKTAGTKIDLANDRATIFGLDVALNILGALLYSHRQG